MEILILFWKNVKVILSAHFHEMKNTKQVSYMIFMCPILLISNHGVTMIKDHVLLSIDFED